MSKTKKTHTRRTKRRIRKTKNNRITKTIKKGGNDEYVNCFIVAHGCYLPNQFIIPYNMTLAFNTPLNEPFCGNTTEIEWKPSGYPHIIDTDTTHDYLFGFQDNTSDLFSSFGVYFNNQKIYEGPGDVTLSYILNYISTLTTKPIRVYCSVCRSECSAQDEKLYQSMQHPEQYTYTELLDVLADI